MDLYFEKNVINENFAKNPNFASKFETPRKILIGLFVIVFFILASTLKWTDDAIFFNIVIFIAISATFITFILFFTQQIKRHCCEYDYIISNNEMKIIKILNQQKRDKILTFDLTSIERIAFSYEEDEYFDCRQKASKQIVASCNKVDDYLIILCTCKGSKILLVCEYDSDFVLALKKSVASFGVFSKEFNKYKVKQ